jgi:hypothetical protein
MCLKPQAFLDMVSTCVGHKVNAPGDWSGAAALACTPASAGSASGAAAPAIAASMPDTVDQMQDTNYQVQKLGFVVGVMVSRRKCLKTEGPMNTNDLPANGQQELEIFKISLLQTDIFTLVLQTEGHDGRQHEVSVHDMATEYRLYKGSVTTLLPEWHAGTNSCSPLSSGSWWLEGVKGAVAIALQAKYLEHANAIEHLELLCKPTSVKVLKTMTKGSLRLVGASQRIDRCKGLVTQGSGVGVGIFVSPDGDRNMFQVAPQFTPPVGPAGANKAPWVAPFWMVADADGDANMQLAHENVLVGDHTVTVPVLTNMVQLKAGTELKWDKKAVQGTKKRKGAQ